MNHRFNSFHRPSYRFAKYPKYPTYRSSLASHLTRLAATYRHTGLRRLEWTLPTAWKLVPAQILPRSIVVAPLDPKNGMICGVSSKVTLQAILCISHVNQISLSHLAGMPGKDSSRHFRSLFRFTEQHGQPGSPDPTQEFIFCFSRSMDMATKTPMNATTANPRAPKQELSPSER